jgi:F0F1-type ATP synthase membrane subunit b/b'
MDSIVSNLIDIDKKARKIIEIAEKTVKNILESIDSEKRAFNENYIQKSKSRIERIREEETNDLKLSFQKIYDDYTVVVSKLEKIYDSNHKHLEQLLFDRVISEIKTNSLD